MTNNALALQPDRRRRMKAAYVALAVSALVFTALPEAALAGTGGEEFNGVATLLTDWLEGTLGRIFVILALIIVGGYAIMRQNLSGLIPTGGLAFTLLFGPDIVDTFFTATMTAGTITDIFAGMPMPPV